MWLEDEVGSSTWNCNDMLRTWGTVMIIVMIIMGDHDMIWGTVMVAVLIIMIAMMMMMAMMTMMMMMMPTPSAPITTNLARFSFQSMARAVETQHSVHCSAKGSGVGEILMSEAS